MKFTPVAYSVKQVLSVYNTFNIPFFQRDYSWEKLYYSKFLDDIISMIKKEGNKLIITDYFIGTMLFVSGTPNQKETVDVIDGQQRLTVITILLSVLSDIFRELKEDSLSSGIFNYIRFLNDFGEYQNRIFSTTSSPYFEKFIQVREKSFLNIPNSEEEENLKKTYEYFYLYLKNLDKLHQNIEFEQIEHKEILISIKEQILNTTVIVIDTADRDKSNMIFEILNAKSKSLASLDLIKNIIFEAFYNDIDNKDKVAQELWTKIQNNLHSREDTTNIATFYRHYWVSKYKKETNSKLYDSFKKYIKTTRNLETKKTIYIDFLQNLETESKIYNQIVKPDLKDYSNRREYKWLVESLDAINNTFKHLQGRIVLLALMDVKNRNLINQKNFKETIIYLENFIFSYSVIGKLRSNFYEPIFSKFAISIRASTSKEKTNELINDILISQLDSNYISYNDFKSSFINLCYKKTKSHNKFNLITKYVTNKIASSFDGKNHRLSDSSMEHILPEAISGEINIGNIIALEEDLNNKADNFNFEEKIKIYRKSNYKQVQQFINKYSSFDKNKIKIRAENLAKFYYLNILNKKIINND